MNVSHLTMQGEINPVPVEDGEWCKFSDIPPTLRVKPLVWEQSITTGTLVAGVFRGNYHVRETHGRFSWNTPTSLCIPCDSIEQGKQLAQAHWNGPDGIGRFLEVRQS
jgi:hypothetical protein